MRLQELFETTQEDRAIISLSMPIYTLLQKYRYGVDEYNEPNETYDIGKVGDFFDTSIPILNDIRIKVQSDEELYKRVKLKSNVKRDPYTEYISGVWAPDENAIIFNIDHLGSNSMRSVVTHELRHALDDLKSDFKAGDSKKYFPATNKNKYAKPGEEDETPPTGAEYQAQPGEINSRFSEVLHGLVVDIRRLYALPPDKIKPALYKLLKDRLAAKHIADFFPEKEKSPAYKRLISRAMDMLEKETEYYERVLQKQGKPKHATGSWN